MKIEINKCDVCGLEARSDVPDSSFDKFVTLSFQSSSLSTAYLDSSYLNSRPLTLCPACYSKLGITLTRPPAVVNMPCSEPQQLYNLFSSIVTQIIENQKE